MMAERANPYRGEITLDLAGRHRLLRLTLGGLARLETALDAPDLASLLEQLLQGGVKASTVRLVLGEALAAGEAITHTEAETLLDRAEPKQLLSAYVALLARTLSPQDG